MRSQITFQRLQIRQNVVLRMISKLPRVTTQTLHAQVGVSIVLVTLLGQLLTVL